MSGTSARTSPWRTGVDPGVRAELSDGGLFLLIHIEKKRLSEALFCFLVELVVGGIHASSFLTRLNSTKKITAAIRAAPMSAIMWAAAIP